MLPPPLVTVYITNYNYGAYLEKAVESVLNQSMKDFELIIIDDGSTDNSREIIEKYKNRDGIRIIYQKNKGLNVTNNIALRTADGKYIMRLDADDYLESTALEKLSGRLEADPELGLVFPDYYLVDKDDNVLSEERRHNFDEEVKLLDQAAHGACTMIRVDFLKDVGGYNESYNCQDGYELWVKFTQKYKVTNINEPLFYYRQHGGNLTSNENRILDTRAQINANYITEKNKDTSTLIVIPVRGNGQDIAYEELLGGNFVTLKIQQALKAKNAVKIVISSPDEKIKDLIGEELLANDKVLFHLRSKETARLNEDLSGTIREVLDLDVVQKEIFTTICVLTIEYPFLKPHKIDDAINTMHLFGSDSLLSVRSDNSLFYAHHGDGLHPIAERDRFTRLEREAVFTHVGGISVVRKDRFLSSSKLINGVIGHMVIDQESAYGVFSQYDYELAKKIVSL